jgi:hypothetical protein
MEPTRETASPEKKPTAGQEPKPKIEEVDLLTLEEKKLLRELGTNFADVIAARHAEGKTGEEGRIQIIEMATEAWIVITDAAGNLNIVADDESLTKKCREKLRITAQVLKEFSNGMLEEIKKAPEFKKVFKWPIDVPPISSPPSETKK